jgi:nucleoside 2-deoxyribosyltransferase
MKTVYLAGPINGCTDAEALDWRDDMTRRLNGFNVISPMTRDYRGKESESVEEIVEGDKADIDGSDIVIAFCPKPSVGTSMEVFYAFEIGKIVIVYAPPGAPISPWLKYHSHQIHRYALNVESAVLKIDMGLR